MIEKSQKKWRVYIQNYLGQKNVSLLLNGKLNKVGRSDLLSKKNLYGMNGGNIAKNEESLYNIEQEGNHGCLGIFT